MNHIPGERVATLRWTGPLVARFWDHYAVNHAEDYFTRHLGHAIAARTARFLPQGGMVCDFGCGAGFLTEHLARHFRCAGIDFSPKNIEATRARLARHPNFAGAWLADEARAKGQTFDGMYLVETVEHLLEDTVEPTLRFVYDSLQPGGTVIVTTPNEEDLDASLVFCPTCEHEFHRWQHVRRFDAAALSRFMEAAGFVTVRTFATDFGLPNPLVRALKRLLSRRPPPHLVYVGRRPEGAAPPR